MLDTPKSPFVIFQRADSTNFWVRFSIPGQGQKRISLKTSDLVEAKKLADEKYRRAVWSAEEGILPGKTSFDRLAREYLIHAEMVARANTAKHSKVAADRAVLTRYMIPFFGKSTVTSINAPKLYEYQDWRRSYWTTGPGSEESHIGYERNGKRLLRPARHIEATLSTLRREAVTMRAVFKHAVRLGYIKEADIPRFDLDAQQRNKRPSFTDAEVARLLAAAEERIAEASLPQVKRNKKLAAADWTDRTAFESRTVYERAVLYGFIDVALETGMRPTCPASALMGPNWLN